MAETRISIWKQIELSATRGALVKTDASLEQWYLETTWATAWDLLTLVDIGWWVLDPQWVSWWASWITFQDEWARTSIVAAWGTLTLHRTLHSWWVWYITTDDEVGISFWDAAAWWTVWSAATTVTNWIVIIGTRQSQNSWQHSLVWWRSNTNTSNGTYSFVTGNNNTNDATTSIVTWDSNNNTGTQNAVFWLSNTVSWRRWLVAWQWHNVTWALNGIFWLTNTIAWTENVVWWDNNNLDWTSDRNLVAGTTNDLNWTDNSIVAGSSNTLNANNNVVWGTNNTVSWTLNMVAWESHNLDATSDRNVVVGNGNDLNWADNCIVAGNAHTLDAPSACLVAWDTNSIEGTNNILAGWNNSITNNGGFDSNNNIMAGKDHVFQWEDSMVWWEQHDAIATRFLITWWGSGTDWNDVKDTAWTWAAVWWAAIWRNIQIRSDFNGFAFWQHISTSWDETFVMGIGIDDANKLSNTLANSIAFWINTDTPTLRVLAAGGTAWDFGNVWVNTTETWGWFGVISIANRQTAPSVNHTWWWYLFAEAWALYWRWSAWNVTLIAPA